MKIEFIIREFTNPFTNQINIEHLAEKLFVELISDMGLSTASFRKIAIADQFNYGSAIQELDPEGHFTQSDVYTGVGKTIYCIDDGNKLNSIVFRTEIIENLLLTMSVSDQEDNWPEIIQFYKYIVCHELGHCIDHLNRTQVRKPTTVDSNGLFKISRVANYYFDILMGEFAACYFSAKAMHKSAFNIENSNTVDSITKLLSNAKELTLNFDGNNDKLFKIAFDASGAIWTILIQYSKIIGSQLGSDNLNDLEVELQGINSELFSIFSVELKKLLDVYPDWSVNNLGPFLDLWHQLSQINGFKFSEGEVGDAVFWQHFNP